MQYFRRVYRLEIGAGESVRTFDGFPQAERRTAPAQLQFTIDQSPAAHHAFAEITLFGLGRESRQAIYNEFGNIRLTAGYVEGYGVIFEGNVHNVLIGREGPHSTVKLYCQSAADVWGEAYINRTFGAGTPQKEIIQAVAATFNRSVEFVGNFDSLPRAIKGRTFSQDSKSAMNELARAWEFDWLVSGGKTVIVKAGATRGAAEPFQFSAQTGLIGSPEITDLGIDVSVLLNPFVLPRHEFELQAETGTASYAGIYEKNRALQPRGRFEAISLAHEGDFYGDQWQTTISGRRL